MKRIEMLCDVKDAPGYLKGELRHVSPETAGYFCGLGWAKDLGDPSASVPAPDLSEKTLEVQPGKHGHAADAPT